MFGSIRDFLWVGLAGMSLSGCVSFEEMPTETRMQEYAWQSLHAVDTAQTFEIARDPHCYSETNRITAQVIGKDPKPAAVIGWGLATGYLHAAVTSFLVEQDVSPWTLRVWQGISIGFTADAVRGNHALGIRIGGGHKYSAANRCYAGAL